MRIGRSILIAGLAVAITAGAYTGYWFYARSLALDLIANWIAARQSEGYHVAHAIPRIEGYPLTIRVLLDDPSVMAPHDAWQWRGKTLALEAQPWNLHRYRVESHGAQELQLKRDGAPYRIKLEPGEATAVTTFWGNGRPKSASLLLRNLRVTGDPGVWQAAEVWVEVSHPEKPPVDHTETALTLSVAGAEVTLPERYDVPLGRKIETLRGDFRLMGAIPSGPVEDALEAWRRSGGTVEVPWLRTVWDRVDLRAQGTVALDEEWRPMGSFSADIRGFSRGMDALAAATVIEPNTATMAKIGLALLAKKPPEGGEAVLTLPITAQSGQLYAGPIRIADLPPVRFLR